MKQGIPKCSTKRGIPKCSTDKKERSSQQLDGLISPCLKAKEYHEASDPKDGVLHDDMHLRNDKKEFSDPYATKTDNVYNRRQATPTVIDLWTKDDEHKRVRVPENFPGLRQLNETKNEEYRDSNPTKQPATSQDEDPRLSKITMDDLEKVLSPRRARKPGRVKTRSAEKLPRIEISKARESATESQASPRGGSQHFNHARMVTELNEVCQRKDDSAAPNEQGDILSLKIVQETRRYSAFTPRSNGDTSRQHTRSQSLPNLDMRGLPKRYFVKLDPVRASATPVNLSARNESSERCRIVSENLRRLDEEGINPSETERKALIGQWIRETTLVRLSPQENSSNLTRELES